MLATLCVLTLAIRPMGHGYYTLALTPLFLMIAEGIRNDPHLIWARLLNTVLGGLAALAAGALLWPDWEGDTLSDVLAVASLRNGTDLGAFAAAADDALRALASALRAGESPRATPDLLSVVPHSGQSPVVELVSYLARQIEVLYASAEIALRAAPGARRAESVPA